MGLGLVNAGEIGAASRAGKGTTGAETCGIAGDAEIFGSGFVGIGGDGEALGSGSGVAAGGGDIFSSGRGAGFKTKDCSHVGHGTVCPVPSEGYSIV